MAKASEGWNVATHGLLTRVADNLHTVNAHVRLPFGDATQRMSVVKLAGGRLLLCCAVPLRDEEMARLSALGVPSFLVVPHERHAENAMAWKRRFPQLKIMAPSGVLASLNPALEARPFSDLHDSRVRWVTVPGTAEQEFGLLVEGASGKTLIVNELIFNLPRARGFRGKLMQFWGYGPGASMPKMVAMRLIRDRAAVRAQLESWAQLGGLERVVMTHGEPLESPRKVLLQLAELLGASAPTAQRVGQTFVV